VTHGFEAQLAARHVQLDVGGVRGVQLAEGEGRNDIRRGTLGTDLFHSS
jgi:hypothetical protein